MAETVCFGVVPGYIMLIDSMDEQHRLARPRRFDQSLIKH